MARPPKSHLQLVEEGKSHMTKEELEQRKSQEEALLTNVPMSEFTETKENPKSHEEFLRVKNLFRKIEKNDDIFAGSINRYAQIVAEISDYQIKREELQEDIREVKDLWKEQKQLEEEERVITMYQYLDTLGRIQGQLMSIDKLIQIKRKMLLDIEKENIMTVASALRSIPKKSIKNIEEASEEEKLFGGSL